MDADDILEPEIFAFPYRAHEFNKVRERVHLFRLLLHSIEPIFYVGFNGERVITRLFKITAPNAPFIGVRADESRVVGYFYYLHTRILRIHLRFYDATEKRARPYEEMHLTLERRYLKRPPRAHPALDPPHIPGALTRRKMDAREERLHREWCLHKIARRFYFEKNTGLRRNEFSSLKSEPKPERAANEQEW